MERYAIYWAPKPDSALAAFGRHWLGSDPESGTGSAQRDSLGLAPELVERATAAPRRYGLHATMKAPFRPAPGVTRTLLTDALAGFCAVRRRALAGPLRLVRLGPWLALVPAKPLADLDWLAAECVTAFDRFRAPLSEADRARRSGLSGPLQQRYFEEFGYPGVLAAFTFHITLAGPLAGADLDAVERALRPVAQPFNSEPFRVDELCWFGDPGAGALFEICSRSPLRR